MTGGASKLTLTTDHDSCLSSCWQRVIGWPEGHAKVGFAHRQQRTTHGRQRQGLVEGRVLCKAGSTAGSQEGGCFMSSLRGAGARHSADRPSLVHSHVHIERLLGNSTVVGAACDPAQGYTTARKGHVTARLPGPAGPARSPVRRASRLVHPPRKSRGTSLPPEGAGPSTGAAMPQMTTTT